MQNHILILGGYGNFGKRIARFLHQAEIPITIAGRNQAKGDRLKKNLEQNSTSPVSTAIFDANEGLDNYLDEQGPIITINTCGPFQNADYRVADSCARRGIHYIDLADGRDFVCGIASLNEAAQKSGAVIISGASSVPGLSSAVIEKFKPEFSQISSLKFGISPGQKSERGFATTKGILGYVGKPIKPFSGMDSPAYGWQDIYRQAYPGLGKRWMANCDIPDLDLLPRHYGIKEIQFSAGMELGLLHLGLWALSGLVRAGVPLDLAKHTGFMLNASNLFNIFGTGDGGMHVIIKGLDHNGQPHTRKWFIIAKSSHGPEIPPVPTMILAKKLWSGEKLQPGAYPCIGLVSLEEYLHQLSQYDIATFED